MTHEYMSVPSDAYDRSYFLEHMDGAAAFAQSHGRSLSPRLAVPFELAQIRPGLRVLDLGCGRGEIVLQCASHGADVYGLDYSLAALEIAGRLRIETTATMGRLSLERGSALRLPFADETFDLVFMLDIVEHLYPSELHSAIGEARRVLRHKGKLIVHTMPNANYYRWGYPMYRLAMALLGQTLPRDPRERWYRGETHVNVQSPRTLRVTLQAAGFPSARVWLKPLSTDQRLSWLTGLPIVDTILCNDILAVAIKT
jgi:ubiquinone/menaquinone biosynthesis C-methylase UbiE